MLKYIHHPLYGLDIGADTFGYIYKGDEHYLSFGINENNKVIMWLGDIVELNVEEQFYLRSENITSDHCIDYSANPCCSISFSTLDSIPWLVEANR